MRGRERLLAWSLLGVSVVCFAVAVAFGLASSARGVGELGFLGVLWGASFLSFPAVGTLIAARRPEHPIGWLFLAATIPTLFSLGAFEFARYALVTNPGSLPGGVLLGWLALWTGPLSLGPAVFILILFPTGRAPSSFWRGVALASLALSLAQTVTSAVAPGRIEGLGAVENPLGIAGADRLIEGMSAVSNNLLAIAFILALLAPFARLRRASGDVRQQLRCFAFGVGALVLGFVCLLVLERFGLGESAIGTVVFILGVSAVPGSMAVAILRYRLYDIDRLVNRTLVYGAVTAVLAAGYFVIVLVLQSALPVADDSPVTVAASTLAVVALFRPVRARIQGFVDRRFNRSRYDAARTIESFGAHLRRHTDLEALTLELLAVTKETMQPAHATLWLKAGAER